MQEPANMQKKFEEAYDEYVDAIFRYFSVRLQDRERAQELTQETFMRAWKYAAGGGSIRAMRAFLYTIASNLFKNELRAKRDTVSLDTLMEGVHTEPATSEPPPDAEAERNILLSHVRTLKPEYQEIILLRYVDDLDIPVIARMLNISSVTASVRIHRAVQKLRQLYQYPN